MYATEQSNEQLPNPFEDIRQEVQYPEGLATAIGYVRPYPTDKELSDWYIAQAKTTKGRLINGYGRTEQQARLNLLTNLIK